MEIELRHLRAFVAVAEEQHFGRAARRLYVSQPPLSQQIQRLERALGAQLFDRGSRPIRLTDAGAVLLEEARRTLAQAERAITHTRRTGRGELGRLVVGALPSSFNSLLPLIVRSFRSTSPEVTLELHTMPAAAQAAALREGAIDVGFARQPVELQGLTAEALIDESLIAVVPREHRLARRSVVAPRELAGEPVILFPRPEAPEFYDRIVAFMERHSLEPAEGLTAPDLHGQLGLVAAGLGITLHMASVSTLARRELAFVPMKGKVPTARLLVISRRDDRRPLLSSFLDTTRVVARANASTFGRLAE
jgi:DNA-binding transcriptional LysR family regulator